MVRLGQEGRLPSRHPARFEGVAEPAHAPLPPGLEAKERHTHPDRQDREGGHEDDRETVAAVRHHSSSSRSFPTAFAMIPPRLREDMYCSVSLKACSSVMPLFFNVL